MIFYINLSTNLKWKMFSMNMTQPLYFMLPTLQVLLRVYVSLFHDIEAFNFDIH